MLNKYWRSFPWYIQLIQFIVLLVVLISFFMFAIMPLAVKLTGVPAADINNLTDKSPRNVVNAMLLMQFISQMGMFLFPALLFSYFTHPRSAHYLGFRKPAKALHWLLPALIMLCAGPLLIGISGWIGQLDLGEAMKKTQEENERMTRALLTMQHPVHLFLTIIVLAITPGFSEELFFRGVIMRLAAKRTYSILAPIIVSALVFAALHSNIYGLVSIFLSGILLGSFYYLTGSMWPGIIAHIVHNAVQIVIAYFSHSATLEKVAKTDHVPVSWILVGTPLAIAGLYLLWKTSSPLKSYWASDYDPHEIMEGTE